MDQVCTHVWAGPKPSGWVSSTNISASPLRIRAQMQPKHIYSVNSADFVDSLGENWESLHTFVHQNLPAFPLLEHTLTCHICTSGLWWSHPGTLRSFLCVQGWPLPKGLVRVCSVALFLSASLWESLAKWQLTQPNSYLGNDDFTAGWGLLGNELRTIYSYLKPAWLTCHELGSFFHPD